jgi:hypothetical protein
MAYRSKSLEADLVIRGAEVNVKVEPDVTDDTALVDNHNVANDAAPIKPPNYPIDIQRVKNAAMLTWNHYLKDPASGEASRKIQLGKLDPQSIVMYNEMLNDFRSIPELPWKQVFYSSLSHCAESAASRSEEQERQFIEAMRKYRSPRQFGMYIAGRKDELQKRKLLENANHQRDMPARKKQKTTGKEMGQNTMAQGNDGTIAVQNKNDTTTTLNKNDNTSAQDKKENTTAWGKNLLTPLTDHEKRAHIEKRRGLAPLRKVSESESFLISRLMHEQRTTGGHEEFEIWANKHMTLDEREEFNRLLWIEKGHAAVDIRLKIPGGSKMDFLWY